MQRKDALPNLTMSTPPNKFEEAQLSIRLWPTGAKFLIPPFLSEGSLSAVRRLFHPNNLSLTRRDHRDRATFLGTVDYRYTAVLDKSGRAV